jgi:hypothetical protein
VKHKQLLVSFQWNDPPFRFTSFIFVYMFPHGPCRGPNTRFDWPMEKKFSPFRPYTSHLMPWLNLSPPMTSIPLSWRASIQLGTFQTSLDRPPILILHEWLSRSLQSHQCLRIQNGCPLVPDIPPHPR